MAKVRINPRKLIKEYVSGLEGKLNIDKVILFGSAAKNRLSRDSDIDIIVLSNDFKRMGFLKRLELLSHARNGNSRKFPMDIIGYTPAEFDKLSKESVILGEAKLNGRVIWTQKHSSLHQ